MVNNTETYEVSRITATQFIDIDANWYAMNRHKLTNEELRHLGIAMVIGRKIDGVIVRNGAITDGRGRGIMYTRLSRSEYLQIK